MMMIWSLENKGPWAKKMSYLSLRNDHLHLFVLLIGFHVGKRLGWCRGVGRKRARWIFLVAAYPLKLPDQIALFLR